MSCWEEDADRSQCLVLLVCNLLPRVLECVVCVVRLVCSGADRACKDAGDFTKPCDQPVRAVRHGRASLDAIAVASMPVAAVQRSSYQADPSSATALLCSHSDGSSRSLDLAIHSSNAVPDC